MIKKDYSNYSLHELIKLFLSGEVEEFQSTIDGYDPDCDPFETLADKLQDPKQLLCLIDSDLHSCQFAAAYISAMIDDNAREIFPSLEKLIFSPWSDVRDEICDCYYHCADSPNQYLNLLKLLVDPEPAIRIKVMTLLCGIKGNYLDDLTKYKSHNKLDDEIKEAILFARRFEAGLIPFQYIKDNYARYSKILKMILYVAVYRKFNGQDSSELSQIATLSNEDDIRHHWNIYFSNS